MPCTCNNTEYVEYVEYVECVEYVHGFCTRFANTESNYTCMTEQHAQGRTE